jgi:hypothetical protein
MQELDDGQWDELRQLHELASLADMETDAAMYAGTMDDAKMAIQSMATAADALTLPDGLSKDLQRLAMEALKAADGADVKAAASGAMTAVDEIEQMIESRFAAAGHRL